MIGFLDIFKRKKDIPQNYLQQLLKLAVSDGHLDDNEFEFIIKVGQKFEKSPEEVAEIREAPEADPKLEDLPRKERLKILYDLVFIMVVDGTIDDNEMNICLNTASTLGYDPHIIEDLVYLIEAQVKNGSSLDEAYDKVYLTIEEIA